MKPQFTSGAKSLDGVQILRGIAALGVVVHHVLEESRSRTAYVPAALVVLGASGVDIFFVISGFLMVYTTAKESATLTSATKFLTRRFLRIFPLYWCLLALVLMLHTARLGYKSIHTGVLEDIAAFLLLPTAYPIIVVAWTLKYELYFYLLFAVSLAAVKKEWRAIAAAALVVCALIVARMVPLSGWSQSVYGEFLTKPIVLEFVLGMAAAYVYRLETRRSVPMLAAVLGTAGIVAASVFAPKLAEGLSVWRFVLWGIPAFLVVLAALSVQARSSRLGRYMKHLGDASYSLYLSHAIVMIVFAAFLKNRQSASLNGSVLALGAIAVSIFVGLLVHNCLEKPLLHFSKRLQGVPARWSPTMVVPLANSALTGPSISRIQHLANSSKTGDAVE